MVLLNNKIMKEEDKELLLKDLCARVPYGLMCACGKYVGKLKLVCPEGDYCILQNSSYTIETIKPYLRPISSMTDEEKEEFEELFIGYSISRDRNCVYHSKRGDLRLEIIDWLNSHHFDYRGLIPMGLAIEAPKDMYVINQ